MTIGVPTQTVFCGKVTLPHAETNLVLTQLLPPPVAEKVQEAVFCPNEIVRFGPHVHTIESNTTGGVMLKEAPDEQTNEDPVIGPPNARITAA